MAEMIALVAAWFPDRRFVLVVDSLYSGKSVLSKLPENFDLIGPVPGSSLVPVEKRAELCGHVNDVTPQKLGGQIIAGVVSRATRR